MKLRTQCDIIRSTVCRTLLLRDEQDNDALFAPERTAVRRHLDALRRSSFAQPQELHSVSLDLLCDHCAEHAMMLQRSEVLAALACLQERGEILLLRDTVLLEPSQVHQILYQLHYWSEEEQADVVRRRLV